MFWFIRQKVLNVWSRSVERQTPISPLDILLEVSENSEINLNLTVFELYPDVSMMCT